MGSFAAAYEGQLPPWSELAFGFLVNCSFGLGAHPRFWGGLVLSGWIVREYSSLAWGRVTRPICRAHSVITKEAVFRLWLRPVERDAW